MLLLNQSLNMLKDNLKSIVYRSLGKGVHVPHEKSNEGDGCETSRRSKTSSSVKDQIIEKRIIVEDSKEFCGTEAEMKTRDEERIFEPHSPSSYQLLQISKEAQKLNQMISDWSDGVDLYGHSSDIARDLLRGALDLQQSLVMLGKLQEASKFMARLKKKPKAKFDVGEEDKSVEESGLSRFSCSENWEKPRLSLDGSSRNSIKEKKKNVIRDALSRHYRLSTEESSFGGEEIRVGESDSRRFGNYIHENSEKPRISVDGSSRKSTDELKKVIRDGLSKQNLLSLTSDEEKEKSFSGRKQFDLLSDVYPIMSRSFSVPSNGGFRNLSDQKVLEKPSKAKSPNLIAKLMGLDELPSETIQTNKGLENTKSSYQQRPVFDIQMPKVRKTPTVDERGDPERRVLKNIIDSMQFKRLLKSSHAEKDHKFRSGLSSTRTWTSNEELPPIVIIKPMHSCPTEEIQTEKLVNEERSSELKLVQKKLAVTEMKVVENRDKSSNKIKASVRQTQKLPREVTKITKKAERIQNGLTDKLVEMENPKSLAVSRHQVQTTIKQKKKLEPRSVTTKIQAISQGKTLTSSSSLSSTKPEPHNSITRIKKTRINAVRKEKEAPILTTYIEKSRRKREDKNSISTNGSLSFPSMASTCPADQQDLKIQIEDQVKDELKPQSEGALNTDIHEKIFESIAAAHQLGKENTQVGKTTETDPKLLLLNSPSFLTCAEQLFDIRIDQPMAFQTSGTEELGKTCSKLMLDCANEIVGRKSDQVALSSHPMLRTLLRGPNVMLSLEQLVEEAVDGIEKWRSYCNIGDGVVLMDKLKVMLGRDLECKSMVINGVWDLGWLNGLPLEEAEQVVSEVVRHVFGKLMEEFITDLPFHAEDNFAG